MRSSDVFFRPRDQVCSSRRSAYAAENAVWLAESFMLVRGIHGCRAPVLTFTNRILSALVGLFVILEQVRLRLPALLLSFDLLPLPCGLHQLRRPSPHQNEAAGSVSL